MAGYIVLHFVGSSTFSYFFQSGQAQWRCQPFSKVMSESHRGHPEEETTASLNVQIPQHLDKALEALAKRLNDQKKKGLVAAIIRWVVDQDDDTVALITHPWQPANLEVILEAMLKKVREKKGGERRPASPPPRSSSRKRSSNPSTTK